MRILELEITDVRGIRHLLLKPNGKNLVIWGPNGSGKSAVVDAVDFLLTGNISRLTGQGTKGITLKEYGPHIDCRRSQSAVVRAMMQIPGMPQPVELIRRMASPSALECDDSVRALLGPIIKLAEQGQHVLTRRDILRYITAESGTRAQRIQELLDVTEVEDVRKALVRVKNDCAKQRDTVNLSVERAKGAVNATTGLTPYDARATLDIANQHRAVLGGKPIAAVRSSDLKTGLRPPAVQRGSKAASTSLMEKGVTVLLGVLSDDQQAGVARADSGLRELVAAARKDRAVLRALQHADLIRLGLKLVDEKTDSCPLCEAPWQPPELQTHLQARLETARLAEQSNDQVDKLRNYLVELSGTVATSLGNLVTAARGLPGAVECCPHLQAWLGSVQSFSAMLENVYDGYPDPQCDAELAKRVFAPQGASTWLATIAAALKTEIVPPTPAQVSWDTLTQLGENLKALEVAQSDLEAMESSSRRASRLLESFEEARDTILGALYDEITARFVQLYQSVHRIDEGGFSAELEPDGAGLDFEVDFYGRGKHPPHALHSEGHQDSMGLCLYLALAERLTRGAIDLVILDDVVMSVDADHRREVCAVLSAQFPDRQFLITTHDKTWAYQLRSEGVVGQSGVVEFFNWHVDTGPEVSFEPDMWERIELDLSKHDVSGAASTLRRGSEAYFAAVCDKLAAPVPYKLSGRHDLGDLMPAAYAQYTNLIRQGKKAANSWGKSDIVSRLDEVHSTAKQIYSRTTAEQWAINPNVHFSRWADFLEKDFRPVVEAFGDLFSLFVCSECGTPLHLTTAGMIPASVRCACGKVEWNLQEKA